MGGHKNSLSHNRIVGLNLNLNPNRIVDFGPISYSGNWEMGNMEIGNDYLFPYWLFVLPLFVQQGAEMVKELLHVAVGV